MFGSGLQVGPGRADDRFYNPAKARRENQIRQDDHLRRAQSDVSARSESREPDDRLGYDEPQKPIPASAFEPFISSFSNLERFLQSTTPSVPAQYLPKTTMRVWRTRDPQCQPYFVLGDLWESFKEWSACAYGSGVPLLLNDSDSVVQYYVPYLPGLQIYGHCLKSSAMSRRPGSDCYNDFRDSSSDGSSDSEPERALKHVREHNDNPLCSDIAHKMDRLSMCDHPVLFQEDCSSDEAEPVNSQGCLLLEYLEHDLPYSREPLADNVSF